MHNTAQYSPTTALECIAARSLVLCTGAAGNRGLLGNKCQSLTSHPSRTPTATRDIHTQRAKQGKYRTFQTSSHEISQNICVDTFLETVSHTNYEFSNIVFTRVTVFHLKFSSTFQLALDLTLWYGRR